MQPTLCARCHKNMAVVFINRIENGQSHQEGLCLKCARELHIKPIDDIISKMGINDEDLDGLSSEMMEAMQNLSGSGDAASASRSASFSITTASRSPTAPVRASSTV